MLVSTKIASQHTTYSHNLNRKTLEFFLTNWQGVNLFFLSIICLSSKTPRILFVSLSLKDIIGKYSDSCL